MTWLIFVLVWVVIAVALVTYALLGGRRSRRGADSSERRSIRLISVGFVLMFLALVFAVPYVIFRDVEEREDIPQVNVENLSSTEREGRNLFAQRCKLCHSLQASGASAKVGPNLDELQPPRELTLDAIENGRARGNGQMAADLAEGEDAEAIADYLVAVAGRSAN